MVRSRCSPKALRPRRRRHCVHQLHEGPGRGGGAGAASRRRRRGVLGRRANVQSLARWGPDASSFRVDSEHESIEIDISIIDAE
jgi:hypothetical protein